MSRYQPVWRRLVGKVRISESGCWLFTGSKGSDGYGQIYYQGRLRPAHVVAYEWFVGPVPDGYEVDHWSCNVRACTCPWHLEAVPPRINMLRSSAPGAIRWRSAYCKRGHPKIETNLYHRKDRPGKTECYACLVLHNLRRAKKNRARTVEKYQFTGETINVRL